MGRNRAVTFVLCLTFKKLGRGYNCPCPQSPLLKYWSNNFDNCPQTGAKNGLIKFWQNTEIILPNEYKTNSILTGDGTGQVVRIFWWTAFSDISKQLKIVRSFHRLHVKFILILLVDVTAGLVSLLIDLRGPGICCIYQWNYFVTSSYVPALWTL